MGRANDEDDLLDDASLDDQPLTEAELRGDYSDPADVRRRCALKRLCMLGAGHEGECGFNLTHVPGIGIPAPDALAEAATKMPIYYRLPGLYTKTALPADVLDAVEGLWGEQSNYHEKDVLKYLVRAGRKPGVPEARDWLKIVRVAARKYRLLSGEDLPDDI